MVKVIKKSSLAIFSLLFMVVIAGYINYKYNPDREKNLGQTVYVNGKDSFEYQNVSIYEEASSTVNSNNDLVQNISNDKQDDAIAVFKYDRDNMFSEMSENYNKIISNENTDKEQINEYQNKLNSLIEEKNLINMVENVIKSRGIEDIVIIPTNNENINVVIKSDEELKEDMIAVIQQILVDQLGADANKISITTKK